MPLSSFGTNTNYFRHQLLKEDITEGITFNDDGDNCEMRDYSFVGFEDENSERKDAYDFIECNNRIYAKFIKNKECKHHTYTFRDCTHIFNDAIFRTCEMSHDKHIEDNREIFKHKQIRICGDAANSDKYILDNTGFDDDEDYVSPPGYPVVISDGTEVRIEKSGDRLINIQFSVFPTEGVRINYLIYTQRDYRTLISQFFNRYHKLHPGGTTYINTFIFNHLQNCTAFTRNNTNPRQKQTGTHRHISNGNPSIIDIPLSNLTINEKYIILFSLYDTNFNYSTAVYSIPFET